MEGAVFDIPIDARLSFSIDGTNWVDGSYRKRISWVEGPLPRSYIFFCKE